MIDLIMRETRLDFDGAVEWLRAQDYIPKSEYQHTPLPPSRSAPARSQQQFKKLAATYDYVDENGALQFQVVRYEPKEFRQRRPIENDQWAWNLDGVRRVPYQLPELIEAVAAGRTIHITEGEKDCDNDRSLGFVATTCAGGAKKWRNDYNKYLREADCRTMTRAVASTPRPSPRHCMVSPGACACSTLRRTGPSVPRRAAT